MITLDRMEKKIDALIAGMNSALAGQTELRRKIENLDTVQDAIRFEATHDRARVSTKLDGIRDGLASEIGDTRQKILLLIGILHDSSAKQARRAAKKRSKRK